MCQMRDHLAMSLLNIYQCQKNTNKTNANKKNSNIAYSLYAGRLR